MSIGPNHRDNHGQSPCIEPHILGRLLDKLEPLKARLRAERNEPIASPNWRTVDALAQTMEAARP